MLTPQEKAAKWPWQLKFASTSGSWFVFRKRVDKSFTLPKFGLVEYTSPAAAIYAIAKTQE